MNSVSLPFVSVIIPVFNDSRPLQSCLAALEKQTYPRERYEIIVVDNGSDEDIKSVVTQFPQAKIAFERRPGSYAARNQAIGTAQGEVLAFTDADCIPTESWLEKGVAHLLQVPNCGLVAGKIELSFQQVGRPTAVEFCDSVMFLNQKKYVTQEHFGATANLFTFKQVFEQVGLFNDGLKSGGDKEWGKRVFAANYAQSYAEEAKISHPARSSLKQLCKKVARTTGGSYQLSRQQNDSVMVAVKDIAKHLKPPMKFILWRSSDPQLSKARKIQFILIMLLLNYLSAWEKVRLELGFTPRR